MQTGERYPSVFHRILAALIDGAALFLLYLFSSVILGVLLRSAGVDIMSLGRHFPGLVVAVITALYYTVLPARSGATWGKLAMGMRVVDKEGGSPGYIFSFIRWLGYVLNWTLFGAGYLLCLFNSRRRGLHDLIAGTRVVSSAAPQQWAVVAGTLLLIIALLWFLLGTILAVKQGLA